MAALLYHTGALGDFITTVPALRFWKARNNNERLVLLGKPSIGEFAEDIGLVNETYGVDGKRFLPLFHDKFSPEAGKILSPFQTAILFAVPDSPVLKNVRHSDITAFYWQPPFPATKDKLHITDYHLSLFTDPQLLKPAEKIPRITPSETSLKNSFAIIPEHLSPVALHPGSGSRKKNWPFERFLTVADAMREKSIPVLWLLGHADEGFDIPSGDMVVSNQPLSLCAALLYRCRIFIGNDSGIAHLAAAVGCRTIALFGPSDPLIWAPRGRDVRVICNGNDLTAITVEKVLKIL
jgi:heptosyltransferase III